MSLDYNDVCGPQHDAQSSCRGPGAKQLARFGPGQTDLDIAEAKAKGYEVLYSEDRVVLLDLDTEADLAFSKDQSAALRRVIPALALWQGETWTSRNGNHHARLEFPQGVYLDVLERLLLEVCLGGDRKRALFSYARLRSGVEARKCSLLWRPRVGVTNHEAEALQATSAEPAPFGPTEAFAMSSAAKPAKRHATSELREAS